MNYYSLQRQSPEVDFRKATIAGQAPDKGLYFPTSIPVLKEDFIKNINEHSDEAIALEVIRPYVGTSIPENELERIIAETVNFNIPLVNISAEISSLEGLVSFSDSDLKTVGDLKRKLTETYSSNVSAEFSFIEVECEREWFAENFEKMLEEKAFITSEEKRQLATELLQFQEFDRFMNAKLPSIKRYGGEGSESTVAFFRKLLSSAAKDDIFSIVLGMPHRGKLNALVTLFKQRPVKIFRKYKGLPEFGDDAKAMMDIPNHFSEFVWDV